MVDLLNLHHLLQGDRDADFSGNRPTIICSSNGRDVLVVVVFKDNYKKNIPPIGQAGESANVNISITLMKVVEIEETDHSIHLQFQISLSWKENRVKYQNLKKETSLNMTIRFA